MTATSLFLGAVFGAFCCWVPISTAIAADTLYQGDLNVRIDPQDQSVRGRLRPDVDPRGVRLDGFLVYPSLDLEAVADDNIFADENNENGDGIGVARLNLKVRSDWTRHRLEADAFGEVRRFADNTAENHENFGIAARGTIDITGNSLLRVRGNASRTHEERGSPNDEDGEEPTPINTLGLRSEFYQRWNRLSLTLDGTVNHRNYEDVDAGPGAKINNDDRDRAEARFLVNGGYEVHPRYTVFLRSSVNARRYEDDVDDNGLDRDSDGFRVDGGVFIGLSSALMGEAYVGYLNQDYEDSQLSDVSAPAFGGRVTWNATGLTTVKASVQREVLETTSPQSSGILSTELNASVDHELLRNLLLRAAVGVTFDDFRGSSRDDDVIEARLRADYLMNRYARLYAEYVFRDRDSSEVDQSFTNNVLSLGLRLQM